jgi:hypothetical protein
LKGWKELAKKVIGLLPASGTASRLGGIPKFCLPLNENENLLQWHIKHLLNFCDSVNLSTRKIWMPIVMQMKLPKNVYLYEIEPTSMSDAIEKMSLDDGAKYIVGMPDTYMPDSEGDFYRELCESTADVTLAAFPCDRNLKGHVGQISIDENGDVLDVMDKVFDCEYEFMWGAFSLDGVRLDPTRSTPSLQIMEWVKEGKKVKAIKVKGKYLDVGTVDALKSLYRDIL